MNVSMYKCDQCGKIEPWGPSWSSKILLLGHGISAWEDSLTVCSDECAKAWDAKYGNSTKAQLTRLMRLMMRAPNTDFNLTQPAASQVK